MSVASLGWYALQDLHEALLDQIASFRIRGDAVQVGEAQIALAEVESEIARREARHPDSEHTGPFVVQMTHKRRENT